MSLEQSQAYTSYISIPRHQGTPQAFIGSSWADLKEALTSQTSVKSLDTCLALFAQEADPSGRKESLCISLAAFLLYVLHWGNNEDGYSK